MASNFYSSRGSAVPITAQRDYAIDEAAAFSTRLWKSLPRALAAGTASQQQEPAASVSDALRRNDARLAHRLSSASFARTFPIASEGSEQAAGFPDYGWRASPPLPTSHHHASRTATKTRASAASMTANAYSMPIEIRSILLPRDDPVLFSPFSTPNATMAESLAGTSLTSNSASIAAGLSPASDGTAHELNAEHEMASAEAAIDMSIAAFGSPDSFLEGTLVGGHSDSLALASRCVAPQDLLPNHHQAALAPAAAPMMNLDFSLMLQDYSYEASTAVTLEALRPDVYSKEEFGGGKKKDNEKLRRENFKAHLELFAKTIPGMRRFSETRKSILVCTNDYILQIQSRERRLRAELACSQVKLRIALAALQAAGVDIDDGTLDQAVATDPNQVLAEADGIERMLVRKAAANSSPRAAAAALPSPKIRAPVARHSRSVHNVPGYFDF